MRMVSSFTISKTTVNRKNTFGIIPRKSNNGASTPIAPLKHLPGPPKNDALAAPAPAARAAAPPPDDDSGAAKAEASYDACGCDKQQEIE